MLNILEYKQKRYETIFDSAPVGIIIEKIRHKKAATFEYNYGRFEWIEND